MATTTSWMTPLRGHCSCGACSYTVDPRTPISTELQETLQKRWGALHESVIDHCSNCRRATSSLACAWLLFPSPWLEWTPGSSENLQTWTHGAVARTFCRICGTSFTGCARDRPIITNVTISSLCEEDLKRLPALGLTPNTHFWWLSGVGWVQEGIEAAARDKGVPLVAWKDMGTGEEDRVVFGESSGQVAK